MCVTWRCLRCTVPMLSALASLNRQRQGCVQKRERLCEHKLHKLHTLHMLHVLFFAKAFTKLVKED